MCHTIYFANFTSKNCFFFKYFFEKIIGQGFLVNKCEALFIFEFLVHIKNFFKEAGEGGCASYLEIEKKKRKKKLIISKKHLDFAA